MLQLSSVNDGSIRTVNLPRPPPHAHSSGHPGNRPEEQRMASRSRRSCDALALAPFPPRTADLLGAAISRLDSVGDTAVLHIAVLIHHEPMRR